MTKHFVDPDPAVELLAIKLYEHDRYPHADAPDAWPREVATTTCWIALAEEDRETYRQMARGNLFIAETEDTPI